ncbi:MAG: hypothetical protein HY700_15935 [Gemmatimonadetes bacterium]|nr:hypothetical protein [Gemmatimonadota bacterium]
MTKPGPEGWQATRGAALFTALATLACGGAPTAPGSVGSFTVSPVNPAAIERINPLGHMTTPFNALPQGRVYLVLKAPAAENPVLAPAAGTVSWILGPKPDYRLEVQVSPTVKYFMDHVFPETGIAVGSRIEVGQRIARHSGATCCVDFGVLNDELVLPGYLDRRRYSPQALLADAPLKYFAEPVRSRLYAKVTRVAGGLDGKHDYDVAGRLVGNWFLQGTPPEGSLLPENWPRQLAFAYSNTHPDMILISVAGSLALTNLFAVQDGAPDPARVSVASGLVEYRLFQKNPPASEGDLKGAALGAMLVRMLDESRIRVEIFPGSGAVASGFTAEAKIYTR